MKVLDRDIANEKHAEYFNPSFYYTKIISLFDNLFNQKDYIMIAQINAVI
jgi:hypothetical protein